jgi:hypothetical protein
MSADSGPAALGPGGAAPPPPGATGDPSMDDVYGSATLSAAASGGAPSDADLVSILGGLPALSGTF